MNNSVPLRRTPMARPRTPLRRVPLNRAGRSVRKPLPRKDMGPSEAIRRLVFDRDGNRCVHCGVRHGLTLQHRVNRQMGGSRDPRLNSPTNLVTMCVGFNVLMEADADAAKYATDMGWKVSRQVDPALVPVFSRGRGWKFLTGDGRAVPCVGERVG